MIDLENLNQFDEPLFNMYFGTYVKEQRSKLGFSVEELSYKIISIDQCSLKQIEAGHRSVSKDEFDMLCIGLELDPQVLINIGRLTQVKTLLDVYVEIDEHYPKQSTEQTIQ